MVIPASLFEDAAAAMADPSATCEPRVRALLSALGYGRPDLPGEQAAGRAPLLRVAARFLRLFRLESTVAPGLFCFGAEVSPDVAEAGSGLPILSVAGSGLALHEAFESCAGEAVERLSMIETAADREAEVPAPAEPEAWLTPLLRGVAGETGWRAARRLRDGAAVPVPVDLCLRRPPGRRHLTPGWPISNGCAAGRSADAAMLHGLLELVERDALALWWRGGRRGRPVGLEEPAAQEATAMLASLRRGRRDRRSWLLDIATELGIPTIVAISVAPEGGDFCFGAAARTQLGAAARAALLELAQIELALELVERKRRERGEAALNPTDRSHLERAGGIHAARCALLHPAGPARGYQDLAGGSAAVELAAVRDRLAAHGFEVLALDLTRQSLGIPVMRMICPGLEQQPAARHGWRLRQEIEMTGGGDCHTNGIPLM